MTKFFLIPFIFLFSINIALANVVINEITWMGTANSANDEWIELRNTDSNEIDISNWTLEWKNGDTKINFTSEKCQNTKISSNGYFLLERTDDTTIPNITADCIYTGALSNLGEKLILKDIDGNIIDTIDASGGWTFGDNITKQTMQKTDSGWITATGTPRGVNTSSDQGTPPVSQPSNQSESTSYVDSGVSWPAEQQIYANAGKDKTVIVGADAYFSGEALGIEKEPLENARYLWNFGDGANSEGQNVKHVYQYPGEYIAVLDVSSGKYSTSDNLLVKAIPNQLKIIEANEEFVKLQNGVNNNLDISGWALRAGNKIFEFPASTFIKANSVLMIPFSLSGIKISTNEKIELLYSNWSVANSFINVKHSVSNIEIPSVVEQIEEVKQVEQSEQVAGVVTTIEKGNFWGEKKWWSFAGLIGILSSAGFLFIRHKYDKI